MTIRLPVLVLAVGLALGGCKKSADAPKAQPAPAASQPAAAQPAPPKPVPVQLPEVLARVNGAAINRAEFDRALAQIQAQNGPVPPDRRDAIYRQVLDQLVANKLLTQEAETRKVAVPDAEIEGQVGEIRKQFPNDQAFTAALAQRQMTADGLRSEIRQQLERVKLLQAEIKQPVVGDKEISDFYQKNPERFQQPETVHVAHILIRVPENADEATKKKAREDIDKAMAELKKKGADFAAVAKKYSQDGSAVNGGDLGFIAQGQGLPPSFEMAAFALQPGQTSAVIETPAGFHILKAMERRPARKVPLEEVKAQVGQFLVQEQMQEKTSAYIEKLKAKGKVEILI